MKRISSPFEARNFTYMYFPGVSSDFSPNCFALAAAFAKSSNSNVLFDVQN